MCASAVNHERLSAGKVSICQTSYFSECTMPSSYSRIRPRSRRRRFLVVVSIIEMIYDPRRRKLGLRIAVQPELEGVDAVPVRWLINWADWIGKHSEVVPNPLRECCGDYRCGCSSTKLTSSMYRFVFRVPKIWRYRYVLHLWPISNPVSMAQCTLRRHKVLHNLQAKRGENNAKLTTQSKIIVLTIPRIRIMI